MYALQYEIGMADGVANGSLGPATKMGLSSAAANVTQGSTDSTKYFVHLFQAALVFNDYSTGAYDGVFSSAMTTKVKAFQTFTLLSLSGRADFPTWASLLVSTGDPERSAKACDCITTITADRAATLKSLGYTTIGRYLTNTPNIPDATDKNIKPGELAVIKSAGMRVFPIFQEGGTGVEFFNASNGRNAARRAHVAAKSYGFAEDTVIYFAVDFDALEDEVYSNVVPHFQGIAAALKEIGSNYLVGVYGARNTCRIVSDAELADYSFVSGMSTGYSGNLGFSLPKNWAFDQIKEYMVGTGVGAINIDKDVMSGIDPAQVPPASSLSVNYEVFAYIDSLQQAAVDWLATGAAEPAGTTASMLVINYLRAGDDKYVINPLWTIIAGSVSAKFTTYVESSKKIARIKSMIEPSTLASAGNSRLYGLEHFGAAASAVVYNGVPTVTSAIVNLGDLGGWAGDLIQTQADFTKFGAGYNAEGFSKVFIGAFEESYPDNHFPWSDLLQDIDALLLGNKIRLSPTASFASLFRAYFGTGSTAGWRTRYSAFKALRFGSNYEKAIQIAGAPLVQTSDGTFNAARTAVLAAEGTVFGGVSDPDKAGLARGFILNLDGRVAAQ
ncbi:putative peptidoglycan binding protein [Rathayibacter tanaceti]|nr:putative peptidoglycan binding domain protein [Rathayibacter tanaceti]TCO32946.1 putative peptidoglycan binding protein [Rathayibacter tanaceti]